MTEYWRPSSGDIVWINYDDPDPIGRCVGYTQDFGVEEGSPRYDQPVILGPKVNPFGPASGLQLKVVHPSLLLPFALYGPEWKAANASGRVGRRS